MSEDRCDSCGRTIDAKGRTYPSDRGEVCRECYVRAYRQAMAELTEVVRRMTGLTPGGHP